MSNLQWNTGRDGDGPHATAIVLAGARDHTVQEFITVVLKNIGEAYGYQDCPAVIFDLWPLSLHICRFSRRRRIQSTGYRKDIQCAHRSIF